MASPKTPRKAWWLQALGHRLTAVFGWHGWDKVASLLTATVAIAALLFTAQSLQATRSQIGLTEQGQLTDRFGKAVEQLGSDRRPVVLGGIYALARLARDSPRDQHTIVEVLAAFIRDRVPAAKCPTRLTYPTAPAATDIQAALAVLGHRDTTHDATERINLTLTCLRGADLAGANFANADFTGAILTGANLAGAILTGARGVH